MTDGQIITHKHTVTVTILVMLMTAAAFGQPRVDTNRYMVDGTDIAAPVGTTAAGPLAPPLMCRQSEPVLLGSYLAFDYWSLDTSGLRDSAGKLHFAVRLWEYNNQNDNYYRYVISPDGELLEVLNDWIGIGGLPVVTDENGRNHFVRPVATTQWFGVTDGLNNIHVFYTSAQSTGWEVAYTKLDPDGVTVIEPVVLTTGADCWNWYLQPVVKSDDTVVVTWIRDTEDICAISSSDYGVTWSDITVLLDWSGEQASCLKTVVGSDDSLHFVWRELNWTTYVEKLWYAKVRPDWSLAVAESNFFIGDCWYPFASIDAYDNLHVTFSTNYDIGTNLYYTRLSGELDLDGAPATDALLTEVPERIFVVDPDAVRYPVNLVDAFGTVHVVYEEGEYGRGTDKDLYYVRLCSLAGDLDCDEDVDLADLASLLAAYGTCEGEPGYEGVADLDGSGCIDLSDLAALLANYGAGP
jgi:hypothetical protein